MATTAFFFSVGLVPSQDLFPFLDWPILGLEPLKAPRHLHHIAPDGRHSHLGDRAQALTVPVPIHRTISS